MSEIEVEGFEKTLLSCEHNITRAAEMLGIAKSTFYRKMKEFFPEQTDV